MKWISECTLFSGEMDFFIFLLKTMTIEPQWLVLCLTMVGGLVFGFGVRMQQFGLRLLGLLIQLTSLYFFLYTVWYPFSASILINSYFFICFCSAFTAFFSAYILEKWLFGGMKRWDRILLIVLFLLGITAWYVGGIREIYMHIVVLERLSGVLLFVSITSILVGLLAENIGWEKLNILLFMQLPAMVLLLFFEYLQGVGNYSLMTGWGATVWPITFFIQYRVLSVLDDLNWTRISSIYHLVSLWLLFFFCNREFGIGIGAMNPLIAQLVQPLFAFAAILSLVVSKKIGVWPLRLFPSLFLWGGSAGIIVIFLLSRA